MGTATSDDAAVWRLDADRALVVTADFITPIHDDPRTWGRIAAAAGYDDQAHLIAEFRARVGVTPGAFARHASELR